jgi:hypothetical protein
LERLHQPGLNTKAAAFPSAGEEGAGASDQWPVGKRLEPPPAFLKMRKVAEFFSSNLVNFTAAIPI